MIYIVLLHTAASSRTDYRESTSVIGAYADRAAADGYADSRTNLQRGEIAYVVGTEVQR